MIELIRKMIIPHLGRDRQPCSQAQNVIVPSSGDKYCLIIVDMQPEFLKMYHLQGIKRLIKAQLDTIDVCIANDYPIIALEYNGKGRTIKPIREAVCRAKHMAIMTKNGEDGFYETNLANSLRCWNVNHPIYAGVSASGCVRSTMNGGINNGFTRFSTSDELIADCWDKKGKDKYPQVFYATSAVNYPKSNLELLTIISSSQ